MSRRGYDDRYDDRQSGVSRRPRTERNYDEEIDITRSRYDGPAPSRYDGPQQSRRGGETVFKERETDTVMTQGRRTERGPRQPDFLREDYGRNENAGQLVIREERREEDDYVSRAPTRRRSMESVRPRRPPPQNERVEKDEFIFRETERERGGPPYPRSERGSFGEKDEIRFERTRSRPPPPVNRSDEEIDIRIRRDERGPPPPAPPPPRSEYRERDVEEIRFRRGGPPPSRTEVDREEITFSRETRSPPPREPPYGGREVRKEEIDINIREQEREPYRGREVRKEEIDIDIRERSSPPPRQRSMSRGALVRKDHEEWVVRRKRTPSPSPPRDFEREEIIIRRKERTPSPEPLPPPREPTPEPQPPPPEPIYRPPIIQEVITHHRHIDHGVERARSPTPPPPPPPPAPPETKEEDLEISIRRQGTRNGKAYDEEITFEQDIKERKGGGNRDEGRYRDGGRDRETTRDISRDVSRHVSRDVTSRRGGYDDESDADYYNRRAASRGYPGEAWNGATKDWGLVDLPPGTERVQMDGIGGGREEITWDRYNGDRRGKFTTRDRVYEEEWGNGSQSPKPLPPPERPREEVRETRITERRTVEETGTPSRGKTRDRIWTEITKDLVTKEAIEEKGYEYEETDEFYYVMEYLRYEDVLKLVEVTEDIRRERRERLREIQWERESIDRAPKMLPPPPPSVPAPPPRSRYDERIYERDVYMEKDKRRYR